VLNTYFNAEKRFAFVEFRTVEETSNALGLDGVMMDAQPIRVRRPNDYNAVAAAPLGPALPSPSLNLAAVGVTAPAPGAATAAASVPPEDQANRLFIGGLPYFLTEPMVKELVEAFGPTKSFKLVVDPDTGNSKGYGFFVYEDQSVTDVACQGLHGMKMGDKTLTVKRATGEKRDTGTPGAAAAGGGGASRNRRRGVAGGGGGAPRGGGWRGASSAGGGGVQPPVARGVSVGHVRDR
jgi:splicing factor U2AF subunit